MAGYCEMAHNLRKKNMKVRILQDEEGHGGGLWEDCIGIIDGTFIPFA